MATGQFGPQGLIDSGQPFHALQQAVEALLKRLQIIVHPIDGRDSIGEGQAAPIRSGSIPFMGLMHMLANTSRALAVVLGAVLGLPAGAQAVDTGARRIDSVEVELVADRSAIAPGEGLMLGLRIAHAPGWHTYWRNSGDSGLPTTIEPTGPAGSEFGAIRWPAPKRFWIGPLANYGYEGEVILPFSVRMPTGLTGGSARFEVFAQWLVCREVCIPGEARLALDVPVRDGASGQAPASAQAPRFADMQAATPDPARAIAASLHPIEKGLALSVTPAASAAPISSAEFFPYVTGRIAAPAPQTLRRTGTGWRLDLESADGADSSASLDGLVLIDGRPFELRAVRVDQPVPQGEVVSVAQRPPGGPTTGSGLLEAIQGRSGSGSTSDAGAQASRGVSAGSGGASPETGWVLSLVFAAVGGLLLNLMPCVFPVIGLKVLGFARSDADGAAGRQAMRRGGFAFAGGVVLSFWALGGLMLALRAAGDAVGWGFQLQSPGFVAAMSLLFLLIGLNFSGLYEFGLSLTRLGGVGSGKAKESSTLGAFAAGVLAVLVATPCTAPFMGSALGLTLTQPAWQAMAIFTAIGLGMALPYALLGAFPAWLKALPRPGRWMQTLREALAFPMYASAAWLAWVLARQAGADAMLRLLLAGVVMAAGVWAWGRFSAPPASRLALAVTSLLVALGASLLLLVPLHTDVTAQVSSDSSQAGPPGSNTAVAWQDWSEARVAQAQAQGRAVFVDFTAAWCVTCQANKQLVLERQAVRQAFERDQVVLLRADWTRRDPVIAAALAQHGRNGVPLYLLYRPNQPAPIILPELLTVATVLEALR